MSGGGPASQGGTPALKADMRWLFFSPSGRLSRHPFLLGWLFLMAVNGFFLARMFAQPEDGEALALWSSLSLVAGLFTLYASAMLSVKRLHDIGMGGVFAILIFIPAISVIVLFGLCIWPGDRGPNAFGERTDGPKV